MQWNYKVVKIEAITFCLKNAGELRIIALIEESTRNTRKIEEITREKTEILLQQLQHILLVNKCGYNRRYIYSFL
jgi:hypothetical protein